MIPYLPNLPVRFSGTIFAQIIDENIEIHHRYWI